MLYTLAPGAVRSAAPPPTDCPPPADLPVFHAGDLPPADIDRVAAHLEHCPACQAALAALDGQTGAAAAAVRGRPVPPPGEMAAGQVVAGRYTSSGGSGRAAWGRCGGPTRPSRSAGRWPSR